MSSAVVVGAGLGGLSTAIRLASSGWSVAIYDKNSQPGGRMSTVSADGYTWDCGPTLIMMPEVLRELFASAGRRLEDYLTLRRVDPYYRVLFEEGRHLDLTGHLPSMVANVEAIEPGAGQKYLAFLGAAEHLSRVTRSSSSSEFGSA
jgi:phytoene dehydrogenase-like protein